MSWAEEQARIYLARLAKEQRERDLAQWLSFMDKEQKNGPPDRCASFEQKTGRGEV